MMGKLLEALDLVTNHALRVHYYILTAFFLFIYMLYKMVKSAVRWKLLGVASKVHPDTKLLYDVIDEKKRSYEDVLFPEKEDKENWESRLRRAINSGGEPPDGQWRRKRNNETSDDETE